MAIDIPPPIGFSCPPGVLLYHLAIYIGTAIGLSPVPNPAASCRCESAPAPEPLAVAEEQVGEPAPS